MTGRGVALALALSALAGCGVKALPRPPLQPHPAGTPAATSPAAPAGAADPAGCPGCAAPAGAPGTPAAGK